MGWGGKARSNIRSSASHLTKETRALRDGRSGSGRSVGSGGGRSVGGSRALLLLVGRSHGLARGDGRAGGTTALARHFGLLLWWLGCVD